MTPVQANTAVGEAVRHARNLRNLSLDTVAEQCAMKASQLSQLERGKAQWTVGRLFQVARVMGVTPTQLLPMEMAQWGKAS